MMIQSDYAARRWRVAATVAASLLLGGCFGGSGNDNTTQTADAPALGGNAEPTTETVTNTPADTVSETATSGERAAVLFWQPPVTNSDGSPLSDLQGYHVYVGSSTGNMARVASAGATVTSYTVNDLSPGTYYFAVSAYNQAGVESEMSNAASKTINN